MPRVRALLLLAAFALWGCLGYGDEDLVGNVIRDAYTRGNPADCTERETSRFVAQITLLSRKGAQVTCRAFEENVQPARSVVVSGVEVNGDTATARVVHRGGAADGRRETLRLVKDANGWKLDRIVALHLTRRAIDKTFKQLFATASPLAAFRPICAERAFRDIPVAVFERAFVERDTTEIAAAAKRCLRTP